MVDCPSFVGHTYDNYDIVLRAIKQISPRLRPSSLMSKLYLTYTVLIERCHLQHLKRTFCGVPPQQTFLKKTMAECAWHVIPGVDINVS